jgi:glycosyltransferase involved in cell wall biosynthesis
MAKKISVAIPTYNRLEYLKECIKSVLGQTFQDFEIFVFDNASEQPVEQELKKFNDTRIHFIGSDKNIGSAQNHNRILQYPFESEYLVIFHDDDAMHPKMLEIEKNFLDKYKKAVFVISDLRYISRENINQFKNIDERKIKATLYQNQVEFVLAVMNWLRYAFSSAMYRVGALGGTLMNFERFSDFADLVFLSELSRKGQSIFLKEKLVNYRVHPLQDSKDLKDNYQQGIIEVIRFYNEILPSRRFSINFLLRSYANINKGFADFKRFLKECREKRILRYSDFLLLDERGIISLLSIILKSKKLIENVRWLKNSFQS